MGTRGALVRARQAGTAPATVSGEPDRHEATGMRSASREGSGPGVIHPRVRKPAVLAPPSTETAQRCWRAPGGVSRGLNGRVSAVHPAGAGPVGRLHPVRSVRGARDLMSTMREPGPDCGIAPPPGTTLYVCVTCRAEGDASEIRAGRRLHDALAAEFAADPAMRIVPVECLSACRRSCAASLAAPGKWTTVYGDLPAEAAASVLAETARLYAAAPDGLIPWKLRADVIKRGAIARIPPLASPGRPS